MFVEFLAVETFLQVEVVYVAERHQMPVSSEYQHPLVVDNCTMGISCAWFLPHNVFPSCVVNHLLMHDLLTVLLVSDQL